MRFVGRSKIRVPEKEAMKGEVADGVFFLEYMREVAKPVVLESHL